MGRGKQAVPLVGRELEERLTAHRLRNRGSRQRARETRRAQSTATGEEGGRATVSARTARPVAGASADPILLEDDDWGDAAVDWNFWDMEMLPSELEPAPPQTAPVQPQAAAEPSYHQEWVVEPWVPPPPADEDLLPRAVPVTEFASTLLTWRGLSVDHATQKAASLWEVRQDELPRLRLLVRVVFAARQAMSFDLLQQVSDDLSSDSGGSLALRRLIERLVLSDAD